LSRLFFVLFTISFIFLVDIHNKFLDMITSNEVLVIKTRTDAQVKRIVTFLLLGSFLEARALTS
jgi:hypothetical protein